MKGKGGNTGNGVILVEKKIYKTQVVEKVSASSNPFVVLCPSEDHISLVLREGEVQQLDELIDEGEVNIKS